MTDQWVVPEGEQWVIYRSGKFSRLADPGPLKLRAKVDTVQQRIDTRNKPRGFQVEQIFWRTSPFSCVLNFWYRTDLRAVAGGNPQKVAALTQFNEPDRYSQAMSFLKDALNRQLMDASRTVPGMPFPLMPGSQECQQMLATVRNELIQSLLAIGIIVDEQRPIVVEWLDMPANFHNEAGTDRADALESLDTPNPRTNTIPPPAEVDADANRTKPDYHLTVDDLRVLKTVRPTA